MMTTSKGELLLCFHKSIQMEKDDSLSVNDEFETGQLADAISDATDFLVDTIAYDIGI